MSERNPKGDLRVREKQAVEREGTRPGPVFQPDVDIFERRDAFVIYADLPGADESSVSVRLEKGVLSLDARLATLPDPGWQPLHAEYRVGGYHREFRVSEDIDGHPVSLAAYVGRRPALFEFWATWCPNCAALEPRMRAAYERHGGQVDFVVVAVAVNQTKASVKRWLARHPLPATRVLWDSDGNAVRAFDTPATSYVVVLDRDGKVAYTGLGPDQNLEAALARVTR